ncbi:MAG: hypothetical protein H2060_09945 [Azoarcus sp.]|nr:hypothetical protein [Azoarcus sp.]
MFRRSRSRFVCSMLLAGAIAAPGAVSAQGTTPEAAPIWHDDRPSHGKLVLGLDRLAREYREFRQESDGEDGIVFRSESLPGMAGDRAFIDAVAIDDDPSALIADLEAIGAEIVAVAGRTVSIRIPLAALSSLDALETLLSARPVLARPNVGAVTSQGDVAQRSDRARMQFAVDGARSVVGVLSDSFDCLSGYADDVASGDLPPDVGILDDLDGAECSDEGRAMAQIVHDIAPALWVKIVVASIGSETRGR